MKATHSKAGRPAYKPTPAHRKIVQEWASAGVIQEKTARRLGIHVDTLRKYYGDIYAIAEDETVVAVAGALIHSAKQGNVPAARFYLSSKAGWVETSRNEVTGKDGGPIEMSDTKARMMAAVEAMEAKSKAQDGDVDDGTEE